MFSFLVALTFNYVYSVYGLIGKKIKITEISDDLLHIATELLTSQLNISNKNNYFYLVFPNTKMVLFYRVSAISIKKRRKMKEKTTCKLL